MRRKQQGDLDGTRRGGIFLGDLKEITQEDADRILGLWASRQFGRAEPVGRLVAAAPVRSFGLELTSASAYPFVGEPDPQRTTLPQLGLIVSPVHGFVADLRDPMARGGIVLARHAQAGRSGRRTLSMRPHPPGQPPHPRVRTGSQPTYTVTFAEGGKHSCAINRS